MADNKLELKVITSLQDKLSAPLKGIGGASAQAAKTLSTLQNKLNNLTATQKNIGAFTQLKNTLNQTKNALQEAQTKAQTLGVALNNTTNPTKKLQNEFNKARQEVTRLKDLTQTQGEKLQTLRQRLTASGVSTRQLSQAERELRNNIAQTTAALEEKKTKLNKVREIESKITANREKHDAFQSANANVAVSAAAGYSTGRKALSGLQTMMAPGRDFSEKMARVQALTRLDKDSEELKALQQQARDLGASTMFSATEAADAQGFLAMAGFTPEAIQKAMPGVLDMAKAGDLDLARAADISSNILSGMNIDSSEMGRVGDVLVGTFTRSNTNLEMLGETMKYAAPMAASLGVDIETLAAATGKLGDAGIQGSMAGTALRSILNRLSAPPKAAAKALDELGIKTKDAKGHLKDFPSLLQELDQKTKNMGSAERAGYFKAIAGEEAVSALNVLVDKSSGELQTLRDALKASEGEATKVAKTMADNITGDLDELSSAWEDIGIAMFTGQESLLRGFIQYITGIVNAIGQWIKENPELAKWIVTIAGFAATLVTVLGGLAITVTGIIGPFFAMKFILTKFFLSMLSGIGLLGKLGTAIKVIGMTIASVGKLLLTNPIILIITAIAGAAYLIWKNWDYLKAKAIEIWTSIKQTFSAAWTYLVNLTVTVGTSIKSAFSAIWNSITSVFTGFWEQLKTATSGGLTGIGAFIANWSPLGLFYKAFAGVLSWFGVELPENLTGAVTNIVNTISEKVSSWNISAVFKNIWSGVTGLFSGYVTQFSEFGSNLISGLVNGIKGMAGKAKEAITNVGSGVVSWFKEKLGIHSPSRVFIGLGGFVSEGLAKGIKASSDLATKATGALAASTLAGAAALANTTITAPVVEPSNIQFDKRPSLSKTPRKNAWTAPTAQQHTQNQTVSEQITINIYSGAMDPQAIARAVKQELERRDAARRSSLRSRYTDYGA